MKLKIINSLKENLLVEGRIYVALNLMTLSNLKEFHHPRNIYWIDGLFGVLFCKTNGLSLKRKPGRELLSNVLKQCDKFVLFGNISNDKAVDSRIEKHYPLINYKEEVGNINFNIIKNSVIIISLPSPLQESLSKKIDKSNIILCIGGAFGMLNNKKLIPPKLLQYLCLEFLWRLKHDTKRRFLRLFKSLLDLSLNINYLRNFEVIQDDLEDKKE
jgi:hypothetical protein